MVGFLETSYTVREDSGQIVICVVIADETRVDFDFTVQLETVDRTAGICLYIFQYFVHYTLFHGASKC